MFGPAMKSWEMTGPVVESREMLGLAMKRHTTIGPSSESTEIMSPSVQNSLIVNSEERLPVNYISVSSSDQCPVVSSEDSFGGFEGL